MTSAIPADHPELVARARARHPGAQARRGAGRDRQPRHRGRRRGHARQDHHDRDDDRGRSPPPGSSPPASWAARVAGVGRQPAPRRRPLFVVEADEYDRSFLTLAPDRRGRHQRRGRPPRHLRRPGRHPRRRSAYVRRPSRAGGRSRVRGRPRRAARLLAAGRPRASVQLRPRGAARSSRARGRRDGAGGTRFRRARRARRSARSSSACRGCTTCATRSPRSAAARCARRDVERDARGARARSAASSAASSGWARRRGVAVVDDYAHHPTEIAATLAAARAAYPGGASWSRFPAAPVLAHARLRARVRRRRSRGGRGVAHRDLPGARAADRRRDRRAVVAARARRRGADGATTSRIAATAASRRCAQLRRRATSCVTLGAGDMTGAGPRAAAGCCAGRRRRSRSMSAATALALVGLAGRRGAGSSPCWAPLGAPARAAVRRRTGSRSRARATWRRRGGAPRRRSRTAPACGTTRPLAARVRSAPAGGGRESTRRLPGTLRCGYGGACRSRSSPPRDAAPVTTRGRVLPIDPAACALDLPLSGPRPTPRPRPRRASCARRGRRAWRIADPVLDGARQRAARRSRTSSSRGSS